MNSFVRYALNQGAHIYDIIYSPRILGGKYCSCNTTCAWFNDELIVGTRLVDYRKFFQNSDVRIVEDNYAQSYLFTRNGFDTRNVTAKYADGKITDVSECIYPQDNKFGAYYRGLEDCRLVVWDDKLYAYGTRWDRVQDKGCICLYELNEDRQPINEIVIKPQGSGNCEKNWGAIEDQPFTFVYNNNPTQVVRVNQNGECSLIVEHPRNESINDPIKGSTQFIRYNENSYISLVHTNRWFDENGISRSDYLTAFVFYDNDFNLIKMSDWFVFNSPMCEFSCGLAIRGNDVYITYSQLDCTSHILKTDKQTIEKFINSKQNYNNVDIFADFYRKAQDYELSGQRISSNILYNYTALLTDDSNENREIKQECLIKTYCNIIEQLADCDYDWFFDFLCQAIQNVAQKYPDACEFYYLLAYLYKMHGNIQAYMVYKQMGDERKLNIHKYFFKYLNPNYL